MKILLASSSFHGGGITSYALELIKYLSPRHDVTLLVGETNGYLKECACNVINADLSDYSADNARKVTTIINETSPDLLINSFGVVVGLITPFLNNNIRIITISHSLRYNESDIAAFNTKYIDKCIALSQYNLNYLKKKFAIYENDKLEIVYNFVTPTKETPDIQGKIDSTNEPIIVFAGGAAPTKSPELVHSILLELLKTTYKFKFYWLGDIRPPLKKLQVLRNLKTIVPNDPRVVFTGKIPRKEAASILAKANIILIPSKREGCPIALLEAMSAGVIVLTSDFKNGCREIVEHADCGFVIPHKKISKFVETITNIIQAPEKHNLFYTNSYKYFTKELSYTAWEKNMDKIVYDTNSRHVTRQSFKEDEYAIILKKWKKNSRFNKIHMLIFETLPSATKFFVKNIFCKHYDHHVINKTNLYL